MKNKKVMGICSLALVMGFAFMALASSSTSETNSSDSESSEKVETSAGDDKLSDEKNSNSKEEPLPFAVAEGKKDLKMGEIAQYKDFYVGLASVRTLDKIQTAVGDYSEDIESGRDAIYPIIQVYNSSKDIESFNTSDISIYVDSVQATKPDTIYLVAVDDVEAYNSYEIDPGKTATAVTAGVVDEGWSEMTIFCGDVSWKLTPDDISSDAYSYSSLFGLKPNYSFTEPGTTVYDKDYQLTFDGMEFYTKDNMFTGAEDYVVFEFTINNTSDDKLDYEMIGYQMRGYCNSDLLDGATYTMDDSINGYSNIYEVDEIHSGMTAMVYVAFPVHSQSGVFECNYDVGYIMHDSLAVICCEN